MEERNEKEKTREKSVVMQVYTPLEIDHQNEINSDPKSRGLSYKSICTQTLESKANVMKIHDKWKNDGDHDDDDEEKEGSLSG